MTAVFATLARLLARDPVAALVTVVGVRGSAPRDAGARMLVSMAGDIAGTVGGGRLEMEAIEAATAMMAAGSDDVRLRRFALGPALGQCCGGHVTLAVETIAAARRGEIAALAAAEANGGMRTEAAFAEGAPVLRIVAGHVDAEPAAALEDGRLVEVFARARRPVFLFGAGHVGRALVLALAPLPFAVTWVDERADMFPAAVPGNTRLVATDRPAEVLAGAPDGSFALVMTHDHAIDLAIVDAALRTPAVRHLGLIGSATKRARFESRLQALGHDAAVARSFRCPIGVPGIRSKEPAVIAAAVAAELLAEDEAAKAAGRRPSEPLLQPVSLKR
jgi:xanthine dehydrogenase accessory factor